MFNGIDHLFARYPALTTNQALLTWLAKHGADTWYEEHLDSVTRVFLIARDETSLHVIDVARPATRRLAARELQAVLSNREHDISHLPSLSEAIKEARRRGATLDMIIGAQYRLAGANTIDLQVEILDQDKVFSYSQINPADRKLARTFKPIAKPIKPEKNDWLAANDLHTLDAFRGEAEEWTAGLTTARDKAAAIGAGVKATYAYDDTILNIGQFTWRDTLTRDRNGKRGVCDEYAIVQMSCLRALGIPARLKYLRWFNGLKWVYHACLEFRDDSGAWVHMDGLWGAFDRPAIYRDDGGKDVAVADADEPDDTRSSADAWGVQDRPADGLLHPYGDFIMSAWTARPGYSY